MQIVITPIIIIIIMIIIYYEFPPVKPNILRNTGYFLMKNNHLNYEICNGHIDTLKTEAAIREYLIITKMFYFTFSCSVTVL